jgi:hypothetical protein
MLQILEKNEWSKKVRTLRDQPGRSVVVAFAAILATIAAGPLMSGRPADLRCTAFSQQKSVSTKDATVDWQFRLCSADERSAAQLRFYNPGDTAVAFTFSLFTSSLHGCETADELSAVLTGSAYLHAGRTTGRPYHSVRLPEGEYQGRLWLCVFASPPSTE